ncbi:DUF1742-domain-containing protein [Neolentinus lepideus HHB14362 ss-1]|uniref:DUF1742-domain-containing protein n=1 Tax=Neolentinus lepideus HHB14362 ss-1 TaxID=1314782 RepID=A0A165TPZ3_9AGAM|nr:DUF1742-domain-containing protein [Neolentinus lepideus HHB14362 ss-1]
MSFTNLYYKRTVGTPKACWICYKPTTTVLATANTTDFIYACDGHLKDPGFASAVAETSDGVDAGGAKKMGLSPEEIAKVKAEWEERQRKKQEKTKEKGKEKEKDTDKGKDEDKDEDKDDQQEQKAAPPPSNPKSLVSSPSSSAAASAKPPAIPAYQRFTLHRDIFAMRLVEHRKRRQTAQAKEMAPRLPNAPRTVVQGP